MKPWPKEKLTQLLNDLEKHRPKERAVAAFDADGTLWDLDLGEGLFLHQIKHRLVELPEDPWAHYEWLKKSKGNPAAYLWLAQVNKGMALSQVQAWAEQAVKEMEPIPFYEEQQRIIEKLRSLQVEIFIVTASIKWAVEPGARRLGFKNEQVLGIETEVDSQGLVTDRQNGVITYREGKAEALLKRTGGLRPYFASGNTEGDKWLLECATHLRLVMSSAKAEQHLYITEKVMLDLAERNGWYSHRYL